MLGTTDPRPSSRPDGSLNFQRINLTLRFICISTSQFRIMASSIASSFGIVLPTSTVYFGAVPLLSPNRIFRLEDESSTSVAESRRNSGYHNIKPNMKRTEQPKSHDESSSQQKPTELYRRPSDVDSEGRAAKKARASRPKVKSGCITCKVRRSSQVLHSSTTINLFETY